MNGDVILGTKTPEDIIPVRFPFQGLLDFGAVISNSVVQVTVSSGIDPAPSDLLDGLSSVENLTTVVQSIEGGLPGVIYNLLAVAAASDGTIFSRLARLAVIDPDGIF